MQNLPGPDRLYLHLPKEGAGCLFGMLQQLHCQFSAFDCLAELLQVEPWRLSSLSSQIQGALPAQKAKFVAHVRYIDQVRVFWPGLSSHDSIFRGPGWFTVATKLSTLHALCLAEQVCTRPSMLSVPGHIENESHRLIVLFKHQSSSHGNSD